MLKEIEDFLTEQTLTAEAIKEAIRLAAYALVILATLKYLL
jgi:hypothetical protein